MSASAPSLVNSRKRKPSALSVFLLGWKPYRELAAYMKPYLGRFIIGLVCGAGAGAVNGLMIFVLHKVSSVAFGEGQPVTSVDAAQQAAANSGPSIAPLLGICALIPLIILVKNILDYIKSYCLLWVSNRVLTDLRGDVFLRMIDQSMDFFNRSKAGDLLQVVFNQTRMAQSALTQVASDLVSHPVAIISLLGSMFWLDWKFTLLMFVLFPISIIPVLVLGRRVRQGGGREEEEAGNLFVLMQEVFAGIRVIKGFARESYEVKRFRDGNNAMLRVSMRWQKAMEMAGPMVEVVASLGIALALLYVAYFNLGAAKFISLNAALVALYPSVKALSKVHILLQKCLISVTQIFDIMHLQPAIQDVPAAPALQVRSGGEIRLESVNFRYNKDNHTSAVRDLSLVVPPGKSYALVGPSGAGKSTVFSLLLRFYDPDAGRILVDGQDIRLVAQTSLRQNIGIVTQEAFLFHDTIYENIRYGRLNATETEIHEAARLAHAHDFILAQPNGYQTTIGDKGSKLSGGQQQRICIARAILKNAPILLLDEATSALDSEAEQKVQAALENLCRGRTVIAIAHRLSTIRRCDQIIVMRDGGIIETGTHAELLAQSGLYRQLCEIQFGAASEILES